MKRQWILMLLIVGLFSTATAQKRNINTEESVVNFTVKSMGSKVKGTIGGMQGGAWFLPHDLPNSYFSTCIDVNTLNTNNKKRDKHLKSDDFLDVENSPQICFVSERVVRKSNEYIAVGKLTMNGVTKSIVIPFTFAGKVFKGNITIDRKDYNIGPKSTAMVGNTVYLEIIAQIN